MSTVTFQVMGRENVGLGTVTVPSYGTGDSIWPRARQLAGQLWHTDPNSITISSVVVGGGEHISMASASNLSVSQLRGGVVLVEPPVGAEPVWKHKVSSLEEQLQDLQNSHKDLQNSHNKLLQRTNRIAMRALMDNVRTKLNGGRELSSDEKQRWNVRIQHMTDAELEDARLTRQQVQLTKYGQRTVQGQGRSAAHDVSIEEMAEAVTCFGADHRKLFEFVHGAAPDDYVFDD